MKDIDILLKAMSELPSGDDKMMDSMISYGMRKLDGRRTGGQARRVLEARRVQESRDGHAEQARHAQQQELAHGQRAQARLLRQLASS